MGVRVWGRRASGSRSKSWLFLVLCSRRTAFVACSPPSGCLGGINNTCASSYTGDRCGTCAPGSYRLSGQCRPCPDTAWLLFLFASVAILILVLVSVYLSRRRLNLAVLGIGMVSVWGAQVRQAVGFRTTVNTHITGGAHCLWLRSFPRRTSCKWCPCSRGSSSTGHRCCWTCTSGCPSPTSTWSLSRRSATSMCVPSPHTLAVVLTIGGTAGHLCCDSCGCDALVVFAVSIAVLVLTSGLLLASLVMTVLGCRVGGSAGHRWRTRHDGSSSSRCRSYSPLRSSSY